MIRPSPLAGPLMGALFAVACSDAPGHDHDTSAGDSADTSATDTPVADAPQEDAAPPPGAALASGVVGPDGAIVEVASGHAAGAYVSVDPGALSATVTLTISAGEDIPMAHHEAVGPPLSFGPSGTTFAFPTTVGLPYEASHVDASLVRVLHRFGDGTIETLRPYGLNEGVALVQVSSFSTLQAVIPTCPAGLTWCDPACVDTTSDNARCGSCHRDCGLGRACVQSECVDAQLDFPDSGDVFVDDVRPGQLAVNATHLYFDNSPYLESTQLMRADKATGAVEPVTGLAGLIAADDTWLYTMQSGLLMRRPLAGGDPVILLDNREGRRIWTMRLTDTHLWYVQENSNFTGSLRRLDLGSREVENMTGPLDPQGGIVVVGSTVYWLNKGPLGQSLELRRWTPGDGQHTSVVSVSSPSGLVADETHLYWVTRESDTGSLPSFGFSRLPLHGTAAEVEVLAGGLDLIGAFVIDATHVYYLSNGFEVRGLYRVPKAGGTPAVIVDNALQGGALVQDATHLYFSLQSGDLNAAIKRAPK